MEKDKIVHIYIEDEMKSSYLDYAMSVIVGRALPDVRDGLKPVHRRILYAMVDLGLDAGKQHKKSARVVGEVLGKYHPHGDTAVYDTMVRMAQDFAYRYPLINGQGNFGSIDGDAAAAMRYTEVKLTSLSDELLKDIDCETVDWMPNFDGSLKEPAVLPANLPNLLINGSSGIAVGMATNIPPHNICEVIDATVMLIDNPEVTIKELMQVLPAPDFPTGGFIYGMDRVRSIYETGKGAVVMRAVTKIETLKNGRESIVVTEIPYQINKVSMVQKIAELIRLKKIEGISALRDESSREGIRVVMELKKDENSQVILNQLYKYTQMQSTFGVIMLALVDNQPKVLNLKQMLNYYLDHRHEVIIRRTKYELKIAEDRAHILEGLKIALSNLDDVITIIKKSNTPSEAKETLISKFELSAKQSQAILEMQLQRLTGLEQDKLEKEYLELIQLIERLRYILSSRKNVMDIIKKDLLALKKKYGDLRRTKIVENAEEFNVEDLIPEEDVVVTISREGYIKRIPLSVYRIQKRGGVGVTGMTTREQDIVTQLYIASTHDYILFFTNRGKVFWLKVHELPEIGRVAKGKAIINLLRLDQGEKIAASIPLKEFPKNEYLIMATKLGIVKKTPLIEYSRPRTTGLIAINLRQDDELIRVDKTYGNDDIILVANKGKLIRFKETQVRAVSRGSTGVKGITLKQGDEVVGMEVIRAQEMLSQNLSLLTVTENGYGKRTDFSGYRCQSRGGSGVIDIKTGARNGDVVSIHEVNNDDALMMITKSGMIIQYAVNDISVIGRNTMGVRLIRLKEDDKVIAVDKIVSKDEEKLD